MISFFLSTPPSTGSVVFLMNFDHYAYLHVVLIQYSLYTDMDPAFAIFFIRIPDPDLDSKGLNSAFCKKKTSL